MATDTKKELQSFGGFADDQIPLIDTALYLALENHPGRSLGPYLTHIKKIGEQVAVRYVDLIAAGAEDNPETKIAALKHVICDQYGYTGDEDTYNDLRNADLIEVIDRRKGLPIALSILAIEAGRAQGWGISGLNFPGHFLLRFDQGGKRVICDPFHQFRILQASDLRQLLKAVLGEDAELSANLYIEASNREILLRLQNNIKFRQIEKEEYQDALDTVTMMKSFAPQEHRLLLDESVLNARLGNLASAIELVRQYLGAVTDPKDRYDAELLLRTLEIGLE
ncbi:MAG: transglutaminase-like domain-containing protein [Pseudobdellovibrionaceae bacterium]|nr:transglutaminase-like domain-containing protein [Pseudobdellovibrionaceae bacterium]